MKDSSYREYLAEPDFMARYLAYQERYADDPRESDKVIIEQVAATVEGQPAPVILDIGCSTGNLLRQLKRRLPDVDLVGGELAEDALEQCRADPALSGISFEYLDALALPTEAFDVVIANAVLCLLKPEDYETALGSIAGSLRPGGSLISFDWLHPFKQELEIREVSRSHPEGMWLYFRSFGTTETALRNAGFEDWSLQPFKIPIDLEQGSLYGTNESGFEDLNSYTVGTPEGDRLIFRGALYTPWCHLFARVAA